MNHMYEKTLRASLQYEVTDYGRGGGGEEGEGERGWERGWERWSIVVVFLQGKTLLQFKKNT